MDTPLLADQQKLLQFWMPSKARLIKLLEVADQLAFFFILQGLVYKIKEFIKLQIKSIYANKKYLY